MPTQEPTNGDSAQEQNLRLLDLAIPMVENLRLLVIGPLVAAAAALALTFAVKPTFTARTSLLPPQQQQQNAASIALARWVPCRASPEQHRTCEPRPTSTWRCCRVK